MSFTVAAELCPTKGTVTNNLFAKITSISPTSSLRGTQDSRGVAAPSPFYDRFWKLETRPRFLASIESRGAPGFWPSPSRLGGNRDSVPRHRLQKGEEMRPSGWWGTSPHPFRPLGSPALGKLLVPPAAWDNSGRFPIQPVLFCSCRKKAN